MTTSEPAEPQSPDANPKIDSAWYGFLIMSFVVVGLAGLFGTFATQIPYERGEIAQKLLDHLAADQDPAEWAALKNDMGDNATILNQTSIPIAERITEARAASRAPPLTMRHAAAAGSISGAARSSPT